MKQRTLKIKHEVPSLGLACVVLMTTLCGCGPMGTTGSAERKIDAKLPSLIGPSSGYKTHIVGNVFDLARGYAKQIEISGTQVQLGPALTLEEMNLVIHDVHFDRGSSRLKSTGQIDFTSNLSQAELNSYLGHRFAGEGLSTVLLHDGLLVTVPVSMWKLGTSGSLNGQLKAEQGSDKVDFEARSAHIGEVPIPMALVNRGLADLNPIIQLNGIPFVLKLNSAEVTNKFLRLSGNIELPKSFLSTKT